MASKYYAALALVALASVASQGRAEDEFQQKEVELMIPLFEDESKSLEPLEVLDLLHQLEKLYVSRDGGEPIGAAEKSRREVVFELAARGELDDENCQDSEYFVHFQPLIERLKIPNIKHYLEHFMKKQLEVCKSKGFNLE